MYEYKIFRTGFVIKQVFLICHGADVIFSSDFHAQGFRQGMSIKIGPVGRKGNHMGVLRIEMARQSYADTDYLLFGNPTVIDQLLNTLFDGSINIVNLLMVWNVADLFQNRSGQIGEAETKMAHSYFNAGAVPGFRPNPQQGTFPAGGFTVIFRSFF